MKFKFPSGVFTTLKSYTVVEIVASVFFIALLVIGVMNVVSPPLSSDSKNTYTESLIGKVSFLNPVYADSNDTDRDISSLIFSGLLKYYPETQEYKSDLGEFKLSADKKTYSFALRKDVLWHDGAEFSADDVYYTFHDVIQSPDYQNSIIKSAFTGVSVEKKDQYTVNFILNTPNSYFPSNLSVGILPYHILKDVAVKNLLSVDFNKKPIGTGPYILKSLKPTSDNGFKVVLNVFDKYYSQKSQVKNIVFLVYANQENLLKDLGDFNSAAKVSFEAVDSFKNNNYQTYSFSLPQYTALFFNTDKVLMKNQPVRRALAKMLDNEEIAKLIPGKEPLNAGLFETNYPDKFVKYDIPKASEILTSASYKKDKDKIWANKKGEQISVKLLLRDYPLNKKMELESKAIGNYIISKWTENGVKVDLVYLDQDGFAEAVKAGDYDALIAGENFAYDMDLFSFWHSSQKASKEDGSGGLNFSNYSSTAVDALLEVTRETFTKDKRNSRLIQIFDNLQLDVPVLFLTKPIYYFAKDGKYKMGGGGVYRFSSDRFWNIANWQGV